MKRNLSRLTAFASVSLLTAACGGDNKDFEPTEEAVQTALTTLSGEYLTQDPILCECFFAGLGYDDAASCERDRVITDEENTCIFDAFVLDRGNAADWLTCQISAERAYTACISGLTCSDSFEACSSARDTAAADCPSLGSSLENAWEVCQEPTGENAP